MQSNKLWTLDELLTVTNGQLINNSDGPMPSFIESLGFDSRLIQPNSLFLALKGERDGHDFVQMAFANGASLAVVQRPVDCGPCVVVNDVQKALDDLGIAARIRADQARRVAITGSVGKTSVTQMIRAGFLKFGRSHAAVKSFNNHIGVPITLAHMPKDTLRAAFELGMNHAGEIGPLSKLVSPHIAVITHIGPVHTENFPDGEDGVMKAKAEIFEGLMPGGICVLPIDSPWFDALCQRANGFQIIKVGGADKAHTQMISHNVDEKGALITGRISNDLFEFRLSHRAPHQAMNALMALTVLELMGVSRQDALHSLTDFGAQAGRGIEHKLTNGAVLIDESYNANPVSMTATIRALKDRPMSRTGRKYVLMSDMLELGEGEKKAHRNLIDVIIEAQIDGVFLSGALMHELADEMCAKGLQTKVLAWDQKPLNLIESVRQSLNEGDVLLIKGSNGSKAHEVVAFLLASDLGKKVN